MAGSDTIFALATPPGRSALAVVRLSGRMCARVIETLTGLPPGEARKSVFRLVRDPDSLESLDQALVTYFPAPASFTGEDCAEFSLHGSPAVIAAVISALTRQPSVRSAEPGEFTRRAFLNGKMDLTQAEAIADLIDSETEFQRRQALRILSGDLGFRLRTWRGALLAISAGLESQLDFTDEADVQEAEWSALISECRALADEMHEELRASSRTQAIRDGFTVLIAGPPNAGKSTLFNALCREDAAIVTEFAGTTRDILRARLDLQGVPITILDSAGIRDTSDPIERIGIERAAKEARQADLTLWLSPECTPVFNPAIDSEAIVVVSKADDGLEATDDGGRIRVSQRRPESIEFLRGEIRRLAVGSVGDGSQGILIRERHKLALGECARQLWILERNLQSGLVELAAEDCRVARIRLGSILGEISTEDVLGEIFGRFCIGK